MPETAGLLPCPAPPHEAPKSTAISENTLRISFSHSDRRAESSESSIVWCLLLQQGRPTPRHPHRSSRGGCDLELNARVTTTLCPPAPPVSSTDGREPA